MDHHHHRREPGEIDHGRAFAIAIVLNLAYVIGEAAAGVVCGSLALLADAGHNLGDVLGLGLSWGAAVLSRRQPSGRYIYGLRSTSILAALANAIILLMVTGGVASEAIRRFAHPVPVAGHIIVWVAMIGIAVDGGPRCSSPRGRPAISI
jgi:cobalt-zinc-cadmium efflux system protein